MYILPGDSLAFLFAFLYINIIHVIQVVYFFFLILQVLNEISQHKIKIYEFPDTEDEEDTKLHKVLKDRVPFAVVGSNTVIEIDGKKIRGRKYPWGIAEGTDLNSTKPACAFIALS